MIDIIYKTDGESHSLEAKGHAGYSDYGNDIVCSAVSSIIYALLGWMENNSEDLTNCDTDVASGDVTIYCEGGERTSAVLQMCVIGLEQIADKYPDHIAIDIIGLAD